MRKADFIASLMCILAPIALQAKVARSAGSRESTVPIEATTILKTSFAYLEPVGEWRTYEAATIDRIPGFKAGKEPGTDRYGGWILKDRKLKATGYFRTEKIDGRWWIVTPEGNLYINKGVAAFSYGSSERQINCAKRQFADRNGLDWERNWCVSETEYLKDLGFNGVGAWSSSEIITTLPEEHRIPYCVMFYVSNRYKTVLKKLGTEDEAFRRASWEGYPNDMVMVFDEGLEEMADKVLRDAAKYADDPYCLGYFVDNELPWRNTNLEFCLTRWPEDHRNHIAARKWLDERKGVRDFPVEQVTEEDRQAFTAYCFARYQSMIRETLRKYDSNHMYLGCRMSNWHYELSNDLLFREAGKYQDIISVNHYRYWQPAPSRFDHWAEVAGAPCLVTEFYVKGEDTDRYYSDGHSGLTNRSGAGWIVHTQRERGYFYQNFVINLMKSKGVVGWHWFMYMDNDPTNAKNHASDADGNKGIVTCEFNRYNELAEEMRKLNRKLYKLIGFLDR